MDYESAQLSTEERALFDAHLAECPSCVDYLQTYRETVRLGKSAFAPADAPLPTDVPEELVQAILAARRKDL
jgi:anti-sigma factor RsiW